MIFSATVERVLAITFREASARRHTHLTLEHLLYVLAHDPDGEKILLACGADLPILTSALSDFLGRSVETFHASIEGEPEQTAAFRRALQTAVLRELTLYGSCASRGEYPACLDMMARGAIDVAPLISAVAPLAEGAVWFRRLYDKEPGLMKVILTP